jgi:hypothetical protein
MHSEISWKALWIVGEGMHGNLGIFSRTIWMLETCQNLSGARGRPSSKMEFYLSKIFVSWWRVFPLLEGSSIFRKIFHLHVNQLVCLNFVAWSLHWERPSNKDIIRIVAGPFLWVPSYSNVFCSRASWPYNLNATFDAFLTSCHMGSHVIFGAS